jgi:hypothetical protein
VIHFEELWEKCEKLHVGNEEAASSIIEELTMKMGIYRAVDLKTEIPDVERVKIKSRIMGEILLTLTHLSLKDNINVFESLSMAMQFKELSK